MSTFIHGIGASENIDSSGEVVSITGLDISSLDKDGVFNWEHLKDQPSQVVGKILKAKKIFSEADCDNDSHRYFWSKVKVPFLYVMGELMDDYKESAKEVAGMFRYDSDKKHQNTHAVMNFSVEGGKINTKGNVVTHSIARKITITVLACNKMAVAELMQPAKKSDQKEDDLSDIFKTESFVEIEVMHKDEVGLTTGTSDALSGAGPSSAGGLLASEKDLNKNALSLKVVAKPNPLGAPIGQVGPHSVMSHASPHQYKGATVQDHRGMANVHFNASQNSKDSMVRRHHMQQTQRHMNTANRMESRSKISPSLEKAMTAGSGLGVSPDRLEGGAALAKEALVKPPTEASRMNAGHGKVILKPGPAAPKGFGKITMKKSEALMRAEADYAKWEKREQFRDYMKKRMPHLTKGEVDAIGQALLFAKSMRMERALAKVAVSEPQHSFFVKKENK